MFNTPYKLFPRALPVEVTHAIVSAGSELVLAPGRVGGDGGREHHELRSCQVGFFPAGHWITGLLYHYAAIANREAWQYAADMVTTVQFAAYRPGDHFDWHVDYAQTGQDRRPERKITVILSLSGAGAHEGGELELRTVWEDTGQSITRPFAGQAAGSVLVFPSMTPHRVLPVLSGERLTATCWIAGAPFT